MKRMPPFAWQPACLAVLLAYAPLSSAAEKQLSEVEVTANARGRIQNKLRDEIITTESVSAREIQKTNAATLNEAVDFKPGVSVQTECSICNVRNVTLNNLPGRFTTILIDGVPIFSSVSSAYGLDMIGVNGVERIDISRGAGTSLIAPEALAGTVNIVSKRPTANENVLQAQAGTLGYRRIDGFFARPFAGGAMTASYNGNQHHAVDGNGNAVAEYSAYTRNLGGLGLFLDDVGGFKLRGRLDVVDEKRNGGALGRDWDTIKSSLSGNPFDWNRGRGGSPNASGWIRPDGDFAQAVADGQTPIRLSDGRVLLPYNSGRGGMSEIIFTQRQQGILIGENQLSGGGKLKVAFGYAHHDQDSFYEGDIYKGKQKQHYSEVSLQQPVGATLITVGVNYRYENLRSNGSTAAGVRVDGLDNYEYKTPGVFAQVYRPFFDDRLEVNGSVRHDKHNVFGNITSPRLNALWHHSASTNSRFAVGEGYRAPTSFFEQDHGILSTVRIDRHIDKPEKSKNASYAFSYSGDRDAFVGSLNYNRITNYALLDSSAVDGTGNPVTLFTQSTHPLIVKGIDATYTFKVSSNLELTVAGEKFAYDFRPGDLAFARPEERAYFTLDYDVGNWDVFARATWTGPMDLKRFYNYDNNPRYNLDGSRKLDKSPSYWVADLSTRYKLSKTSSLLFGINNVFDYRQTKVEDYLWINSSGRLDVTHVWGPNRGRQFYAGFRLDL